MKTTDKKNKKALKKSQPSLLEVFDKPMISQEKEEKHLLQIAKEKELREANEEQTRRYGRRYGKIIDIQTYEV